MFSFSLFSLFWFFDLYQIVEQCYFSLLSIVSVYQAPCTREAAVFRPPQKAKEADLHRLADALLEYETLTASEIRQVRPHGAAIPSVRVRVRVGVRVGPWAAGAAFPSVSAHFTLGQCHLSVALRVVRCPFRDTASEDAVEVMWTRPSRLPANFRATSCASHGTAACSASIMVLGGLQSAPLRNLSEGSWVACAQVLAGTFKRSVVEPTAAELMADMELEAALAEERDSAPAPLQAGRS